MYSILKYLSFFFTKLKSSFLFPKMWFYECSPAYSLGSQFDVRTKNLSWSMQLEHWFNELEKTGMPGIILENPKSSMEHISVQVLHPTTTSVVINKILLICQQHPFHFSSQEVVNRLTENMI